MRHWVYALVLGILLGLGLGVGGTLLWHAERKQAPPPVTPAVVALFNNSGNEEFYFALNRSVRLVDRDLLQNSLRLREAERKDESRMTRYRKVSQEFGAKLLVIIENTGQGPKFIGDRETHHNKDYAQIFEVDSGVLLRAWDNTNNDWPAKPAPVAEAVKTLAERLGVTRPEAEAAKAALPKPPKTPTDLRVWRDTEAEQFCKDLRIEAYCFKYEGGWVDCWIDIDGFGPVAKPERLNAEQIKKAHAAQGGGQPSGSFVWIRRLVDKEKEEQLAFRASVKFSVKPPDGVIAIDHASISSLTDPWRARLKGTERLDRGKAEVVLRGEEVVTLVTLLTAGEKEGEVSRTLKLQCKALK